jgi:hypothetical protein
MMCGQLRLDVRITSPAGAVSDRSIAIDATCTDVAARRHHGRLQRACEHGAGARRTSLSRLRRWRTCRRLRHGRFSHSRCRARPPTGRRAR